MRRRPLTEREDGAKYGALRSRALNQRMGSSLERPFTLSNPMVTQISDVISTYVYRVGLQQNQYNIATAVGLFQSVVGVVLVFIADKTAKLMGEGGII